MNLPISLVDNRAAWVVPAILVLLGWCAQIFMGYHSADLDLNNRVTAVETQQRADSSNEKDRLNRIEDKLDRLFYEVTGKKP